jgi:hypothetical protein
MNMSDTPPRTSLVELWEERELAHSEALQKLSNQDHPRIRL